MSSSEQSVFIVEDDAAIRDSLGLLLGMKGYRTQAFACAEDFVKVYDPAWAGCLLLDIRMPGMGGLRLQALLNERRVTLPVIIMTAFGDMQTVRRTLRAGAIDFLEKPVDPDALLRAISDAYATDSARRTTARETETALRHLDTLTAREREVLGLVVDGRHYREIATELGISPRTVEVHRAHIMEKLQVRNISQLVRLAITVDLAQKNGHP